MTSNKDSSNFLHTQSINKSINYVYVYVYIYIYLYIAGCFMNFLFYSFQFVSFKVNSFLVKKMNAFI